MTNLKRHRVLADMSQQQLADLSEISLYRIQVIERGWHMLRMDEAKKIAKVLRCKPNELTEGEKNELRR